MRQRRQLLWSSVALAATLFTGRGVYGDETCMSPYMPKITGQEDYVYVWTLGIDGVGDGSDKLVTVGREPANAATYGKVVSSVSVGGRHEAHHARLHRRPPPSLGERSRRQHDLRLRRRHRSRAARSS